MIATIPALVAVVGLLAYALSSNAKIAEIGRISFACGLLVALLALEHYGAVRILP